MFGGKDAVVLVKKNFNPEKAAENFLREVFLSMGLIIKIETKMQDKHLLVDLTGDDMGILIGKRGQTLDALQYLVNLVVNKTVRLTSASCWIQKTTAREEKKHWKHWRSTWRKR